VLHSCSCNKDQAKITASFLKSEATSHLQTEEASRSPGKWSNPGGKTPLHLPVQFPHGFSLVRAERGHLIGAITYNYIMKYAYFFYYCILTLPKVRVNNMQEQCHQGKKD